jgi:hypothetical protein
LSEGRGEVAAEGIEGLDNDSVMIGTREYPVWPAGQEVRPLGHRTIGLTTFADAAEFHAGLVARINALQGDPRFANRYFRAAGGIKVYHLDRWECPEADLLNARALHVSQLLLGSDAAAIDLSWANVSRHGDYALAQSHERTAVSIVYCVDPGDEDPMDPLSGKLAIVDPRVEVCCPTRKEAMTNPLMPRMGPGTMVAFPSVLVHSVNPYTGTRPRITVAWNIDKDVIPGSPLPPGADRYGAPSR